MSLQVELLEQSFNYIKPYGDLFVSSFYENIFKNNSKIQSLFIKIDSETQKNKFWESLVLVMENLRQPDILKNTLQGFGARLFTDGILSEHYPLVRDAFLATFAQFLGDEWTAEFEQAWKDAYVKFRELMLEGAEQASRQITRKIAMTELPSKSTATTTAKKVKLVIDEKTNQLENESSKSNTLVIDKKIDQLENESSKSNTLVIDEKTDQLENESNKSNKLWFIGGGIAGAIGFLLLLIILL